MVVAGGQGIDWHNVSISFSENGYSLNVEFHPKRRHERRMAEFMQKFIDCGIRYGSRVHLPKDHTLTGEQFRALFPRSTEFLEIKKRWDPDGLFQSDLYRRLFVGGKPADETAATT